MTPGSSSPPAHPGAPVARDRPVVSAVIAVYDEAERIEPVVRDVLAGLAGIGVPFDVLILNDGSNDWSAGLEARLAALGPVRVHSFYPNAGKGAMVDHALGLLEAEIAVVIDADGEYAGADIPAVLAPLLTGRADWVLGSRYGFGRPRPRQYALTYAVNRIVNLWFWMLSGVRLHDLLTGLYAFRVQLVDGLTLRERRFSYTAELAWALVANHGLRSCEVPIGYRFRSYAEGKKIRWWETATILAALVRYRLTSPARRARPSTCQEPVR
jgi:glycosyltransferase involved in cell wall biosynthesis